MRLEGPEVQVFDDCQVGEFVQWEPRHENSFSSDSFLQSYLARVLPAELLDDIRPDLTNFGLRCATDIQVLGRECEANPPQLIQTSAWGERVDILQTCPAWKQLKVSLSLRSNPAVLDGACISVSLSGGGPDSSGL